MANKIVTSRGWNRFNKPFRLSTIGNWIDAASFSNLAQGLNAIGKKRITLLITAPIEIGKKRLFVSSNINLQFLEGGFLKIKEEEEVIVYNEVSAGNYQQIKKGKGKLRFAHPTLISVCWYGVKPESVAEQNDSLIDACDALQESGGGHLYFPPGIYRFFNQGGSNTLLYKFKNLSGVTITGYSVVLALDPKRDWVSAPSSANFFFFCNCHNIFIDGFEGTGPKITPDGEYPYGVAFARFEKGCSNIRIPYLSVQGWQAAIITAREPGEPDNLISKGFDLGFIAAKDCTYGINFQRSGTGTTITQLKTENVYRSFFIYGTENISANINSHNPKGRDLNMGALSKADENIPLRNIKIKYTNIDSNETDNRMAIWLYFWGHGSAGLIDNIELDINIKYGSANQKPLGAALWISKMLDDLNLDQASIPRGHVFRKVKIKAAIDGDASNDFAQGGALIRTQNGCDWTGETWTNVSFEDISIVNSTESVSMLIDPRANKDALSFKNIVLPGDLHLWGTSQLAPLAPAEGKIFMQAIHCRNLNKASPQSQAVQVIDLLQDQYAIPIGWQGLTLRNPGAFASTTYNLPAAQVALEYTFLSSTPQQRLRIAPNNDDQIRGGTSGKYLSLDTQGSFVTLRCYSEGIWEIVAQTGSFSFEP